MLIIYNTAVLIFFLPIVHFSTYPYAVKITVDILPFFFKHTDRLGFLCLSLYRRKKVDDKQKDETQPEPTESPREKPWKMMDDVSLQALVKEAKESILTLSDEREQWAALAR